MDLGKYKSPKKLPGTIWGITTFFNPAGYKNKKRNYDKFRNSSKKQGFKIIAIELEFETRPFELKDNDAEIVIRIRGNSQNILWQKERLLNIGLKALPYDCDKVIWVDCDIIFHNDSWLKETADLLEQYVVLQPFQKVFLLKKGQRRPHPEHKVKIGHENGNRALSRAAAHTLQASSVNAPETKGGGHPGFVWAIRREAIHDLGFYDRIPLGGADDLMYFGFCGEIQKAKRLIPHKMFSDYKIWSDKIHNKVRKSVYYCNGSISHLWHGGRKNRMYSLTNETLTNYDFDPQKDIIIDENGLWKWSSDKHKLHEEIRNYFWIRNEEGADLKTWLRQFLRLLFFNTRRIKRLLIAVSQKADNVIGQIGIALKKVSPGTYSTIKNFFPDNNFNKKISSFVSGSNRGNKFILVKGIYGLGNRIYSILMALTYSKLTGRKIIIDWTDGMYANSGEDGFSLLFNGLESIKSSGDYEKYKKMRIYPRIWEGKVDKSINELAKDFRYESEYPDPKNVMSADFSNLDYQEESIVLFDYTFRPSLFNENSRALGLGKISEDRKTLSALIDNNLNLNRDIKDEVAQFIKKHFKNKMIGVQIRYTDNLLQEFTKFNKGTFPNRILKKLEKIISQNKNAGIFLATDNRKILEELQKKYTDVVSLDKFYDPEEFKPIHSSENCPDKVAMARHAVLDMYLLSHCDYLIYSSKSSFAKIAAILSKSDDSKIFDADPQRF